MTEWQLGMRAFREGRLREAVDRLRATTADHERKLSQCVGFQVYAYLGAALYALGQPSEAAQAFAGAVDLRLEHAPPLDLMINLANAHLAAGRLHEAEQTLIATLKDNPGAMEARTLLDRLLSRHKDQPLTGEIFGETPHSVKLYINTLSFSTLPQGYAPDQVHAALTQIEHYIDVLAQQLDERSQTVSLYVSENERLRQAEETLIENVVQARQEIDRLSQQLDQRDILSATIPHDPNSSSESDAKTEMTPLEKLFQKKA